MLPHLFRLGDLQIPTHETFVALAALLALWVFLREADRQDALDRRTAYIAMGALVCGALAAKLATLWRYVEVAPEPSVSGALLFGGKSILGGLAGAYAGAVLTKRLVGYRESTGDLFAPGVALGMAVGRVGCFLTEQVGTPTSLPWGVTLDPAAASRVPMCPTCAPGVPMHPSFLYEIGFHLAMFAAFGLLRPRITVRGDLFKLYLLAYAVFRFLVEFVRGNPPAWWGLSYSQLFLIPATLALGCYFARQLARGVYEVPPMRSPA